MQEAHVQFLARRVEGTAAEEAVKRWGQGHKHPCEGETVRAVALPKAKLSEEEEPGDKGNCEFWIVSFEIWGLALQIVERKQRGEEVQLTG